jgi:hypothetical protein
MEILTTVPDALACAAGRTIDDDWYVASLCYASATQGMLEADKPEKYHLVPGVTEQQFHQVLDDLEPRRLVLSTGSQQTALAENPRHVIGPVCPQAPTNGPVVAWTQRDGDQWLLQLFYDGRTQTVHGGPSLLQAPAVERHADTLYVACTVAAERGRSSIVLDSDGREVFSTDLVRPRLISTGEHLYLLGERTDADSIRLELVNVLAGGQSVHLQSPKPYAFHPGLCWDDRNETLYVAAELSDRWGHFELIGIDRRIGLWQLTADGRKLVPAEATVNGMLGIEPAAFADYCGNPAGTPRSSSCPPLSPVPLIVGGKVTVAYRQFRPRGFKGFGWDLLAVTRQGYGWSEPARLTERIGPGDAACGIVSMGDEILLAWPAFDQRATRSFEEEARGDLSGGGVPQPVLDPVVEVRRIDLSRAPAPATIPADRPGVHLRPPSWAGIAPDPPVLDVPGKKLLWCDLHTHTSYSKCMAAMDGSPEEVARFQRDVLGCKVLTFTDHLHLMSEREMRYHYDVLEAEAGDDCFVLYGSEPGTFPDHHTNFYTLDREIAERLWRIVYRVRTRSEIYRRIRKELPERSVAVMRHFHGGYWGRGTHDAHDPRIGADWAADLEIAAEAMQNRGCSMMGWTPNDRNLPNFPNNFFDKGAKMGLVGGSDHNGGRGCNHYCITGFWVDDISPQGVWDAIWNRRTIAGQNGKTAIWTRCAGKEMGLSVEVFDRVRFCVQAASARPLRRAALMVDGRLGQWLDLEGTATRFDLEHRYYGPDPAWACVVVEADSAYQDAPTYTFSTPHWLGVPGQETS